MSKFKIGDICVLVKRGLHEKYYPLGATFTIDNINKYNSRILRAKEFDGFALEEDVELHHIFHSPLYQALN